MTEYSYNFSTLIHEIGHSLGLKHPFEKFPTTSDLYGNGDNIFQEKYDQMRYSVMSYTDNRDYTDSSIKYDGTQLELPRWYKNRLATNYTHALRCYVFTRSLWSCKIELS